MGKVLIQVGASEEARAAVHAGVPSGKTLVLPRSNVPEDLTPKEEKPAADSKAEKADAEKESKPEVSPAACSDLHRITFPGLVQFIELEWSGMLWSGEKCLHPAWTHVPHHTLSQ